MPRPCGTFPFESAARQSLAQFAKDTGSRVDSARTSVPGFGRSAGSKAAWAARSSKKSDSSTLLQKLNFADSFPQTERESIYKYCKAAVTHQSGDYYEDLSILRMDGSLVGQTSSKVRNETQYSRTLNAAVKSAEPYTLVSLHNHGTNIPPSGADFGSAGEKKYAFGIVACHDGTVYKYSTRNARPFASNFIDIKVDIYSKPPYNMGVIEAFQCALRDAQDAYGIEWSELK